MTSGPPSGVVEPARCSAVVSRLLDGEVETAELVGDLEVEAPHPLEARLVAQASAVRRREFAAGRACARAVLTRLGHPDFPLLAENRAPLWPTGVVGSISHAEGFCVAAAAPTTAFASLGVDIERAGRLDETLWPIICTPGELEALGRVEPWRRATIATVVFSAKEAFYKCQYPLRRAWVGFEDVSVELCDGRFRIVDVGGLGLERLSRAPLIGAFALWRGYVVSAIGVRAQDR